jgi:hypothetical protein
MAITEAGSAGKGMDLLKVIYPELAAEATGIRAEGCYPLEAVCELEAAGTKEATEDMIAEVMDKLHPKKANWRGVRDHYTAAGIHPTLRELSIRGYLTSSMGDAPGSTDGSTKVLLWKRYIKPAEDPVSRRDPNKL